MERGSYGEEDGGGISSPQTPRGTTRRDDQQAMAGSENHNIEDVEGQLVGGFTTATTPPVDEDQATVELQVDAYVVGEPPVEQRRGTTTTPRTPAVEATVILNETHVEAQTWRFLRRLVVLAAVALTLAIALPLALQEDHDDELETPSPTAAPELKDPWLVLQPIIGNGFEDGSYEQKAYHWLTVEDQSGILEDPDTPEWRIVQRFVLANFYFATKGTEWSSQLRFLSKDAECTWKEKIEFFDYGGDLDGFDVSSLPAGVTTCDSQGRVESLRIAQNGLQNTIPSVLGYLSGLKELVLDESVVLGESPSMLWTLNVWFDSSPIPSWLADLTALKTLVLSGCSLTGTFPTELKALTNLQYLALSYNGLTGTIPGLLFQASLSELRVVDLSSNDLTGTLPSEIGQLSNLEFINLGENRLTGTLPDNWGQCTNLEFLAIVFNFLTGTLPESWSQWTNMQMLYLGVNNLVGTVPASWSAWTGFSVLSLSSNRLDGTLPDAWGQQFTKLEHLGLSRNSFTGTLPEAWGQLTALLELDLSHNTLTGPLPDVWSHWTSLKNVGLNDNFLTGTLPEAYGSWRNITRASFSANCFDGTIPLEYELEWTLLEMEVSTVLGIQREDCQ